MELSRKETIERQEVLKKMQQRIFKIKEKE